MVMKINDELEFEIISFSDQIAFLGQDSCQARELSVSLMDITIDMDELQQAMEEATPDRIVITTPYETYTFNDYFFERATRTKNYVSHTIDILFSKKVN